MGVAGIDEHGAALSASWKPVQLAKAAQTQTKVPSERKRSEKYDWGSLGQRCYTRSLAFP